MPSFLQVSVKNPLKLFFPLNKSRNMLIKFTQNYNCYGLLGKNIAVSKVESGVSGSTCAGRVRCAVRWALQLAKVIILSLLSLDE